MSSAYSKTLYTTVTPVLGGVVVVLNIIELAFILKLETKNGKLKKSYIYITSLCVSDIMVGLVMIILKSMDPFMKTSLKGDIIAEEIYSIIRFVFLRLSMLISVFNLLALTFDRFYAITYPLVHRKHGKSFSKKVVILIWVVSFVCTATVYSVTRLEIGNIEKYNNMFFPAAAYTTTVLFVVFYAIICKVIHDSQFRHQEIIHKTTTTINNNNNKTQQQQQQQQHLKENPVTRSPISFQLKFLRLAIMTVCVFCICWLPLATCYTLLVTGCSCGGKDVERTLFVLAFSNSILDPFVYFLHSRKYIKRMLAGRTESYMISQNNDEIKI